MKFRLILAVFIGTDSKTIIFFPPKNLIFFAPASLSLIHPLYSFSTQNLNHKSNKCLCDCIALDAALTYDVSSKDKFNKTSFTKLSRNDEKASTFDLVYKKFGILTWQTSKLISMQIMFKLQKSCC